MPLFVIKKTYSFLRGAALVGEEEFVLVADEHLVFDDLELDGGLLVGRALGGETGLRLFHLVGHLLLVDRVTLLDGLALEDLPILAYCGVLLAFFPFFYSVERIKNAFIRRYVLFQCELLLLVVALSLICEVWRVFYVLLLRGYIQHLLSGCMLLRLEWNTLAT